MSDRYKWEAVMLSRRDLTGTQKTIVSRLALFFNVETGQCNPKVETLAEGAGVAVRTVQAAITRAERLGMLKRGSLAPGRGFGTNYVLLLESKRVQGRAPFSAKRVQGDVRKGAPP